MLQTINVESLYTTDDLVDSLENNNCFNTIKNILILDEMNTVKWGIIGCGDVAEVKSGPAFYKVANSELLAVMRRSTEKVKDFAKRHNVPLWYDNVEDLLANKEINAVYIATPPSSHLAIAKQALNAGKFVYLEKPMTLDLAEAIELRNFIKPSHKIVVAHYRRELEAFKKVKDLIDSKIIGNISHAKIEILQPENNDIIADTEDNWRVNPEISGGGYFNDIAPHQLDLMRLYFGDFKESKGFTTSTKNNKVDDVINGSIEFKNGIQFQGIWNFTVSSKAQKDECIIYGDMGTIKFSFYGEKITLETNGGYQEFSFKTPKHVQQPLITSTVNYFLDKENNPCTVKDGLATLQIIDSFIN
ncbi:Gfo/Idh/MocA family protein [Polaribacter sp.]|uniref:Gfo/Idh/MocA family protein n=1 Tax=Polaribacter sp. TaxID=1920175 RepID=UPI003F6D7E9A